MYAARELVNGFNDVLIILQPDSSGSALQSLGVNHCWPTAELRLYPSHPVNFSFCIDPKDENDFAWETGD
jgi:hypothetical protein